MTRALRLQGKRVAARFGVTSSAFLWQNLALRRYRRVSRSDPTYQHWLATEAPRWLADHWGHEVTTGSFERAHLASQLYGLGSKLQQRLGSLRGASVLDAGASDGFYLACVDAAGGVGINFLVDCARKVRADGYRSCLADVERLPFPDRSFDYVICFETLEHVPNQVHAVRELARVCRKRLVVTVPWVERTTVHARPMGWPETEGHIFELCEEDFVSMLSHAPVRITYRDRVQVFSEPRNPLLQWWFRQWMYRNFFPKLQYYELEPVA